MLFRSKTPSRTIPTKHARGSDVEQMDERPAVRRIWNEGTPATKATPADDESPFTQDNPFQSGSSPVQPATATRGLRRATLGYEQKEKRRSDAHRRKTYQPKVEQLDDGISVPTRGTFEMRVSRTQDHALSDEEDSVDAGEEFTPEEQLELARESAKTGTVDVLPPRRHKQPHKASGTLKAFSLTLLGTAAALLGGVWRQEKFAVGF